MKYDELLSNIDETLSGNSDVKKLLIDTCHIISESGNYSLCWIGLINEFTGRIEPILECVSKRQYLEAINFTLTQGNNEGQSDNIFTVGKYYVNNDIWNDKNLLDGRNKMFPSQFNSLAIFPIIQNLITIGAVYLYSDIKGFFKHDELMLLQILSMNLSLALDKLYSDYDEKVTLPKLTDKVQKLKRQNEKLLINRQRTEELNRLRAVFLTSMGHKIRTPLNSIIGFAELLAKTDISDDERTEYSQLIITQSNNLLQNISNILQISNLDTRTIPLYKETLSLNSIFDDLLEFYQSKLDILNKKHIKLICRKPQIEAQFEITTDISKFKQIFTNLLDNSVKFTESGQISFGYYSHINDELTCFVSDTGAGINTKDINDLFDIFKQADAVSKRNYGDTHLGLAICKANAQLLGGNIRVESTADKGTTFYFTINYTRNELKPASIKSRDKYLHWNTREILLIEDDACTIQYLSKILEKEGLKILAVHNKKEAEEIFQRLSEIDLVLLDMSLPDVSGLDLVKQIRVIRHDIPVIAQTALTVVDNGKQFLDAGCDGYITKPYKREQIMGLINSFMI